MSLDSIQMNYSNTMEGNHNRKISGGKKNLKFWKTNDTILNAGAKEEMKAISENTVYE